MDESTTAPAHLYSTKSNNISDFAPLVMEKLGFGVVIIDADTHQIVYVNSKLMSISGFSSEGIVGRICHNLLCPAGVGECPISDLGNTVDNSERKLIRADGVQMSIIKTVVPLLLEDRMYYIESIVDNSERKEIQEQLTKANENLQIEIVKREEIQEQIKHLAYHDYLTGLPNRLLFSDQLSHAIPLSNRMEKILAIMFLDLDSFKMINDTMGHAVGDQLLVEVSKRLDNTLRKCDVLARIGGDEFVILIENIEDVDAVNAIANKILKSFTQPFRLDNQDFFITTSIGIAIYPTDGNNAEILIKNADIAMYTAKEKGRNQYALCTPIMKNKVIETVKLSNQLYRAVDRGELELYYQPQINSISNNIIGLEALIRWNHPELGLVSPGKFIPIAEQTGLINTIGEWVIRTACKQNKAWQNAGFSQIPVAVNLSVRQFQNPNIVAQIEGILIETGLDPQFLELEITESIAIYETSYVVETLKAFKSKGIIIAIDDFGTEYSSLNYLKQLPADRIKIAMPFIQGIDLNEKDEAITKAIIVLANSMGLRVIAEGVETENQVSFLTQHQCYEVQGFYYYKPMPVNEVEKVLQLT